METLIAFLLGLLASLLQGNRASKLKRWQLFAISLGACFIAGAISTFLPLLTTEEFDINSILGNIGVSFSASQILYNIHFKKLN